LTKRPPLCKSWLRLWSINRFHWLQAAVAWGLSTDQLIMLSGIQLLIFAVAYAVWGLYVLARMTSTPVIVNISKSTWPILMQFAAYGRIFSWPHFSHAFKFPEFGHTL
jgi:hypothetical protein